jgi:hypothetical protein
MMYRQNRSASSFLNPTTVNVGQYSDKGDNSRGFQVPVTVVANVGLQKGKDNLVQQL